ncbi:hypothetical protein MNKW57_30650 [Biformimicrobium ophioploci]|uniref:Uncharacterized protein n=1 Tax=Biformimicrobium ophioploci TaxID=3036711 RepID=A0ABQ6M376_9GAMM|nr:hypothetical protein MNKW57_30650 [Microbulbifer sp. NKW57]
MLAQQYRVINIDLRGHGRSGAVSRPFSLYDLVMDVVAVLDSLDIHRAVWCGLSIGGMVAMRAALACPDRVAVLAQLSQVQVPALVLVGAEDSSLPPPLSRRIHEQLADSRLVQLPAAGHLSVLEQADAVNAALLDFLPRCGATSGW